jgi:cysteine desulfurase/selenocysteine lyase
LTGKDGIRHPATRPEAQFKKSTRHSLLRRLPVTILTARTRKPAPDVAFDVDRVRADFPILGQSVRGKPLVYLDNAATTQKPQAVIDALTRFYTCDNANVHRGVHQLSERATQAFEEARLAVQRFLNAAHSREIIFVRGATEGINLVAQSFGRAQVRAGDEIIVSGMEHHSNLVPWQMLCAEKGARLRVIPVSDDGDLVIDELARLLGARTRLVAVVHVSNALGTVNPVQQIVELCHGADVPVLVDGAQAASQLPIDVQELDCDFYVFSGHKVHAPTGIGVLYGKAELLEEMPPYQGGGDMIRSVTFEKTTYNTLPYKFEAGTPHIDGAIGLGAALDYLQGLGPDDLLAYAIGGLAEVPGLRLVGTSPERSAERAGAVSFVLDGAHAHDIGTILDQEGIAIRTGHHCAQPVMDRFGVPATTRASFACYNTRAEVDALIQGLGKVRDILH